MVLLVDHVFLWGTIISAFLSFFVFAASGWLFWKHRNEAYFVRRDRGAIIGMFALAVAFEYILMPLFLFSQTNPTIDEYKWLSATTINISILTLVSFSYFLVFGVTIFTVHRMFLLLLTIRYHQDSRHWRMKFNPNFTSLAVKYYKKLTKNNKMLKMTTLIYIIICVPLWWLAAISESVYIYASFILFAAIVLLVIILLKIGKFADYYFIRLEFWLITLGYVVCTIELLIAVFVFYPINMQTFVMFLCFTCSMNFPLLPAFMVCFPMFINRKKRRKVGKSNKNSKSRLLELISHYEGLFVSVQFNIVCSP